MRRAIGASLACAALFSGAAASAGGEVKVLLCTGDYGMWAQERAERIREGVAEAAPGEFAFETEQSFNFVRKLEAPGYPGRFDVIAVGDVALGQMTTRAQQALVDFVAAGGGLVYVVEQKSTIPFAGSREVEPLPLAAILPYAYPAHDPVEDRRPDATTIMHADARFAGLDFSATPLLRGKDGKMRDPVPPVALERRHGKGKVVALYGAFSAAYRRVAYAKYEREPGGWDAWPGLGEFWTRLLRDAATASPVRALGRAEADARLHAVPCEVRVTVDATKPVDEIRAAVFSMVALQQLYNEDGGRGEEHFLALNPQDWYDRRTQEVLGNAQGVNADKPALLRRFNIKGILMGENSYGSYGKWDDAKFDAEVAKYVAAAKQYPDILTLFQPGNEPPCDKGYFDFHNRIANAMIREVPEIRVVGPGVAWNLKGPDEKALDAFLANCGAVTDVLNWHIYARCPSSVRDQVRYWTRRADGRLRAKGPVRVMFTEADAWNTRESQFNYLMDRALTFLPMPEIEACFQYCIRPRSEGGTYQFGVLFPDYPGGEEFMANYNAYWIFRNLRGRMAETKAAVSPSAASEHCRAIASVSGDGSLVTVVAYYDTGYVGRGERSDSATVSVDVRLPPGSFALERSRCDWSGRTVDPTVGTTSGQASASAVLAPCQAVAWTWKRVESKNEQ
jgi:hypothetical protein